MKRLLILILSVLAGCPFVVLAADTAPPPRAAADPPTVEVVVPKGTKVVVTERDAKPDPKPDPGPVGRVARFVVVEDTAQAGPWRGDLMSAPAVQRFWCQAGLTHRVLSTAAVGPDGFDSLDAEAKQFLAAAKGKELPRLWTLDSTGQLVAERDLPKTVPDFLKALGAAPSDYVRAFGNRVPLKAMGDGWPIWNGSPKTPKIPRAAWKEVDLAVFLPPVHDQNGRGQCNASASCTVLEAARAQAGLPYVYLSAGDLYSRINDGRDQGSLLEDSLATLLNEGVASADRVPYVWDGARHDDAATKSERKLYRAVEVYACPDFDSIASALQQGFFIVEGLMWFNNFTPDQAGWLPARGVGAAGGHALAGFGLAKNPKTGAWGVKTRNSWGPDWGVNGNCVIPETLYGNQIGGFWAIRSVVQTTPVGAKTPRRPFDLAAGFALGW